MITFIIKIVLIIVLLIISYTFIKYRFINTKKIRQLFKDNVSVGVCGARGMGKDTLFSYISSYEKEHNSNISLHPYTNVVSLKSIMIPGISRRNLTDGIKLNIDREKYSFLDNTTYISDSAIYFPNYEDEVLKKEFPYFCSELAIWRHLFEGNIHFNIQRHGKLWLQIREHIQVLIECRGCTWLPFYCILHLRYFENVKDYEDGKTPLAVPIFKKRDTNIIVERSTRGMIMDFTLLIPRRKVEHDDKIFRKIVFKESEV